MPVFLGVLGPFFKGPFFYYLVRVQHRIIALFSDPVTGAGNENAQMVK